MTGSKRYLRAIRTAAASIMQPTSKIEGNARGSKRYLRASCSKNNAIIGSVFYEVSSKLWYTVQGTRLDKKTGKVAQAGFLI